MTTPKLDPTSPQPEVWLVRHGATEWSENGRHTGTTDLPLLPEGEAVAASLAPALSEHDFSLVLSSPLSRARETARLAGFAEPGIEPRLVEWDYGDYEGLTTPQIRERDPEWTVWCGRIPNGESPEQVARRTEEVIERCLAVGGDSLLFAHGHVLRVLAATWLHLPPDDGRCLALGTATVSVLGWEHDYRTLRRWNAPV